jgi:hypothetical protein
MKKMFFGFIWLVIGTSNVFFLGIANGDTSSSNYRQFREASNGGPVTDELCRRFGGVPSGLGDKELKTIVRHGENKDGVIVYRGDYYVIYGVETSSWLSLLGTTTSLGLCRF